MRINKTPLLLALALTSLSSCTFLINKITSDKYEVTNIDKKALKIFVSHNINGETHPCGCRHNPLGGLPQVAGAMHEASKDVDTLYVDTGDTFFPSAKFPESVKKSLNFTADALTDALNRLGLKYFVPGDQDFGQDMLFLKKLNKKDQFTFLLSNLSKESQFKHKNFAVYKKGPHQIFLMGIVDPTILSNPLHQREFVSPLEGIKNTYEEVKNAGYEESNPFHRLILLSHSGMDADINLSKRFPHFDWIIGAHSQSFTRHPLKYGKTTIAQVLSRNHYLGVLTIDLTKDKKGDNFEILEMNDGQKDKLKPNPYIAFIDEHKTNLKKVQEDEQKEVWESQQEELSNAPYSTSASCIECHSKQGEFWQGTAHSIAYSTLMNANEEKNLSCIQCHSLGLNDEKGFKVASEIIRFDKKKTEHVPNETAKLNELKKNYWTEVKGIFAGVKSVRALKASERRRLAQAWQKVDDKHSVTHNFANVQCLNCHSKHPDHPFTNFDITSAEHKYKEMKSKCLNCHVPDQSPEWYKGSQGKKIVDELVLVKKMKLVGCPQLETQ